MPLCGFNKKMLEGLTSLTEGLVEYGLVSRCEKNSETIEQGIRREISDMTRLLPELQRIDDLSKRIMTEGMVKYAQGFYLIMRKNNVKDYKKVTGKIMDYFQFMEDKYYKELEGKSEDMKELVEFLDKKEIIL